MSIVIGVVIFLAALLFYMRYVEPRLLLRKERKLNIGWQGKIVFVSDLHADTGQFMQFCEKADIDLLEADVVILGGDFLMRGEGDLWLADMLYRLWKKVGPKKSILAVLGNHDVAPMACSEATANLRSLLVRYDITLLENEEFVLNDKDGSPVVQFVGCQELESYPDYQRPSRITPRTDYNVIVRGLDWLVGVPTRDCPRILISHNPDGVYLSQNGVVPELVLAGHTHGGQAPNWLTNGLFLILRLFKQDILQPRGSFGTWAGERYIGFYFFVVGDPERG